MGVSDKEVIMFVFMSRSAKLQITLQSTVLCLTVSTSRAECQFNSTRILKGVQIRDLVPTELTPWLAGSWKTRGDLGLVFKPLKYTRCAASLKKQLLNKKGGKGAPTDMRLCC